MEQIQMLTVANAPLPKLPILAGSAKPHHSEMKPAQLNEERLTKNRKITSQAIMINGMTTHYQWKVANSEQAISPEIIIRSIRIDNLNTKVIWILQRIEDIIEHPSCPLRIG
jgi:hypothetical protein